uniref:Exportin-2 C-terminal domain-containing protein n=1 Tax=Glossina brevipalpis TaxID=37001 RepID=A0A1A9X3E6_9MUSC
MLRTFLSFWAIESLCTIIKQGASCITYWEPLGKQQEFYSVYNSVFKSVLWTEDDKAVHIERFLIPICSRYYSFLLLLRLEAGAPALMELVDQIQANMFGMVIERVFISDMTKVTNELERKIVAVGVSKILIECRAMLSQPYLQYWSKLLPSLIDSPDETILESDNFEIENGG